MPNEVVLLALVRELVGLNVGGAEERVRTTVSNNNNTDCTMSMSSSLTPTHNHNNLADLGANELDSGVGILG